MENIKTGKYVSISEKTSGSQLKQDDINRTCYQQWFFEEEMSGEYAGYYNIRNVETGLYMTVENNSSGDADVILSELVEGSTGQYWRTDYTSADYYKIIPACGEASGKVLALDSWLFGTLDFLVVRSYSDDSNLNDEWEIWQTSRVLFARIIYDSSAAKYHEEMEENFFEVAEMLEEEFGVIFVLDYIDLNSDLNTDDCPTRNMSNGCYEQNCGANSLCATLHHRGAGRLVNIDGDYSSSTYILRIVSYGICLYVDNPTLKESEKHGKIGGFAIVNANNNILSTRAGNLFNLMRHELCHNLGAKDHEDTETSSGRVCIMSKSSGTFWCDSCRTDILNRLYYDFF